MPAAIIIIFIWLDLLALAILIEPSKADPAAWWLIGMFFLFSLGIIPMVPKND